jgi:tRNA threonylcarbamoyladenosine biosynthesis protein TsaB
VNLLAVETSSTACSVALLCGDTLSEQHVIEAKSHTRVLLPIISELTRDAGLALTDVDAFVLGNGPGSFIGMRIGASVVQGLAFAAGRKVVPVSSLAAVASEVLQTRDATHVVVLQDARMGEVYCGSYARGPDDLPRPVADECIVPAGPSDRSLAAASRVLGGGAAWQRYPALQAGNPGISAVVPVRYPRAGYLLGLAAVAIRDGHAVLPEHLQPAYLRTQVARPADP